MMSSGGPSSIQVKAVFVVSCTGVAGAVPSGLLPITEKCALEYWLDSIKSSRRLQPLSDKVYVVCTSEHHPQVLAWAAKAGLASRCIIKDTSQASCLHLAQGIAAVVQSCPGLNSCYLLAADASYVLEPGTSLAHLVETSVVQGKDVITSIVPFEGADLSNLVLVHKEDPAASYSRVRSIETSAEGAADGCWDTMMGPACVLNPTSVSCISAAVAAPGEQLQGLNTIKQLGAGLQQQLAEGKVVCSRDLPFFFSVASQEDYEITKAFFAHYTKLQGMAAREVQQLALSVRDPSSPTCTAMGTLDELLSKLKSMRGQQPASPTQQQLLTMLAINKPTPSPSDSGKAAAACTTLSLSGSSRDNAGQTDSCLKRIFVDFYNEHQEALARMSKEITQKDYSKLPSRFEKSESWDLHPKQQHPCYNTSNNDYGAKHPTNFDMPLLWAGIQGKFTGTFHGECYKQMGLKTSVERSRVHRALDYL